MSRPKAERKMPPPGFIEDPAGFMNVPISNATRDAIHELKNSMGVPSQAHVIEIAIAMIKEMSDTASKHLVQK